MQALFIRLFSIDEIYHMHRIVYSMGQNSWNNSRFVGFDMLFFAIWKRRFEENNFFLKINESLKLFGLYCGFGNRFLNQ